MRAKRTSGSEGAAVRSRADDAVGDGHPLRGSQNLDYLRGDGNAPLTRSAAAVFLLLLGVGIAPIVPSVSAVPRFREGGSSMVDPGLSEARQPIVAGYLPDYRAHIDLDGEGVLITVVRARFRFLRLRYATHLSSLRTGNLSSTRHFSDTPPVISPPPICSDNSIYTRLPGAAAATHLTDVILFSVEPSVSGGSGALCCLAASHYGKARAVRKRKRKRPVNIGGAAGEPNRNCCEKAFPAPRLERFYRVWPAGSGLVSFAMV